MSRPARRCYKRAAATAAAAAAAAGLSDPSMDESRECAATTIRQERQASVSHIPASQAVSRGSGGGGVHSTVTPPRRGLPRAPAPPSPQPGPPSGTKPLATGNPGGIGTGRQWQKKKGVCGSTIPKRGAGEGVREGGMSESSDRGAEGQRGRAWRELAGLATSNPEALYSVGMAGTPGGGSSCS